MPSIWAASASWEACCTCVCTLNESNTESNLARSTPWLAAHSPMAFLSNRRLRSVWMAVKTLGCRSGRSSACSV
ncbi:Uncharacterised protein [Bordetella pertussis]|nr:Uncharacterised protein [Bordetella pertussis]CPN30888.1 Uncharacterised protein [Bordetella pertussis]